MMYGWGVGRMPELDLAVCVLDVGAHHCNSMLHTLYSRIAATPDQCC